MVKNLIASLFFGVVLTLLFMSVATWIVYGYFSPITNYDADCSTMKELCETADIGMFLVGTVFITLITYTQNKRGDSQ